MKILFKISVYYAYNSENFSIFLNVQIKKKAIPVQRAHVEKHLHLVNCSEAVALDDFAEFVVDATHQLQAEKEQNIADIFAAGDTNGNDVLEFSEFQTLYKLL